MEASISQQNVTFLVQIAKLGDAVQQLNTSFQETENKLLEMSVSVQQTAKFNSSLASSTEQQNYMTQEINDTLVAFQVEIQHLSQVQNDNIYALQEQDKILLSFIENTAGQYSFYHPVHSCAALPPSSPSGYYWVRVSNGSTKRVYCDLTRSCGNIAGRWMRVTKLDMTNRNHHCPGNLSEKIYNGSSMRTCVRMTSLSGGYTSVTFSTNNDANYTSVCGRVIAYQYGNTEAFDEYFSPRHLVDVDGVILTHGDQRRHIWTFAAARAENARSSSYSCPCTNPSLNTSRVPVYVENDYFCDTGNDNESENAHFYSMLTLFGMELVVGPQAHAVSSITLHGSTSSCHSPPLMTLR